VTQVEIASFLSLLTNIPQVLDKIDKVLKGTRGKKRGQLLEIKQNVITIELFSKNQAPIDRVIENLRIGKMEDALTTGYKFNRLNTDRVTRKETGGVAFYQAYIGWATEQLSETIYLKIVGLKDIVKMDSDNPNIRKNVRLLNVLKMIKLLLVHISKK
jgi:hypothetical protein